MKTKEILKHMQTREGHPNVCSSLWKTPQAIEIGDTIKLDDFKALSEGRREVVAEAMHKYNEAIHEAFIQFARISKAFGVVGRVASEYEYDTDGEEEYELQERYDAERRQQLKDEYELALAEEGLACRTHTQRRPCQRPQKLWRCGRIG